MAQLREWQLEERRMYRMIFMLVTTGESLYAVRIPRGLNATAKLRRLAPSARPTNCRKDICGLSRFSCLGGSSLFPGALD